MLHIEAACMPGALVFHTASLCKTLGIKHLVPEKARWQPLEYLVCYKVPIGAITETALLAHSEKLNLIAADAHGTQVSSKLLELLLDPQLGCICHSQ